MSRKQILRWLRSRSICNRKHTSIIECVREQLVRHLLASFTVVWYCQNLEVSIRNEIRNNLKFVIFLATENDVSSQEPERYVVKAVPMDPDKDPDPVIEDTTPNEIEEATLVEDEKNLEANVSQSISVEDGIDTRENVSESLTPENETNPISEPDILSFREYTQKALEEEQKKREIEKRKKTTHNHPEGSKESNKTVASIGAGGLKKNFASLDCGAKIAAANAESQSASNIFTPSRDEYMRNACTDKAWFIVELCESIKALKIEIANHELYSSVFKDFRVSLSNVFPGRDKDWTLFGQFEAKDERFMQAFMSSEGVFGKYVKVEILSHHGSEYFCPISSFKIYGISEIGQVSHQH